MSTKPRWMTAILNALAVPENKGKIVYQVATVDSHHVPHVRTQVHRGFIIPKSASHLSLLVTSSDVRAPKVVQMLSNTSLELAWWMEGSQDQFRISGRAHVVSPPDNAFHTMSRTSESLAMASLDSGGEGERDDGGDCRNSQGRYDWEKKRREVFEAMKPGMKASWCAPVAPGSQLSSYDEPSKWPQSVPYLHELKTEEEKKNYETALANFALIVIEATRLDWVQLGERPNRRTLFTRKDESAGAHWVEEILSP